MGLHFTQEPEELEITAENLKKLIEIIGPQLSKVQAVNFLFASKHILAIAKICQLYIYFFTMSVKTKDLLYVGVVIYRVISTIRVCLTIVH